MMLGYSHDHGAAAETLRGVKSEDVMDVIEAEFEVHNEDYDDEEEEEGEGEGEEGEEGEGAEAEHSVRPSPSVSCPSSVALSCEP